MTNYQYKVGGSLEYEHPTYVKRQADRDLYAALKNTEFCYVLNSRQMGKSSLRVQMMNRLKREGIKCAAIDMTRLGSHVDEERWYGGIVSELLRGFGLGRKINFSSWWQQRSTLPPLQRLGELTEDVLLTEFSQNIVIFIDEIDSILRLSFSTDDFFAFIRACYNLRAEKPEYNRLTFCLLGVATPSDLIQDKTLTPFNIGRAIELTGFKLEEAKESLIQGLVEKVDEPQTVLERVLNWTGGQPFLTQKLCQLIVEKAESRNPQIQWLVRKHVIENWEAQDEPQHLRTIRDRILRNEKRASRLLGLYQQILESSHAPFDPGGLPADRSPEQMELRLTGLVVRQEVKLKVYNRIYKEVFDSQWVENALAAMRPYSEAIAAWSASNCQDTSRLLRGRALQDALDWAEGKSLSDRDYQFLNASQEAEKRAIELEKLEAEIQLEAQRKKTEAAQQANEILNEAKQKADRIIQGGIALLLLTILGAGSVVFWAKHERKQAKLEEIEAVTSASQALWRADNQLGALINGVRSATKLQAVGGPDRLREQTVSNLQRLLSQVQERNRIEGHQAWVWDVAWSPDGKTIATGSADATARLWSPQGQLLNIFNHRDRVYDISWSPDGQKIATASKDNTVNLWNLDGELLQTFKGHQASVFSVNFSPDGEILASTSADNTVKLWRINPIAGTPTPLLQTLKGHTKDVTSVAWSPDGKMLASASFDNTVKIWSLNRGSAGMQTKIEKTLGGHDKGVATVAWSPDGQVIISASGDGMLKIWNRNGDLQLSFKAHDDVVQMVRFSPDGRTIATASEDTSVKLWSLDGSLLKTWTGHNAAVYGVSWSPDGHTIASASADKTVKLWKFNNPLIVNLMQHDSWVYGVSVSPTRNVIASASRDNSIKLWTLDGKLLNTLKGHQDWVYGVSWSPDGEILASASKDKTIKLWRQDGQLMHTLKGHTDEVNGVAWSPDSQRIASASRDNTVRVWQRDGKLLQTLEGHRAWVYGVAWSPDGQRIASASKDQTVKLWHPDGRLLTTLEGHIDEVNGVAWSPDSQMLASTSDDNTVKLWHPEGRLLHTLEGHREKVTGVSFSPTQKVLATGSFDTTVKVWSFNGELLKTFEGHGDQVFGVSFSPTGTVLASGGVDKTIKLWSLEDIPAAIGEDLDELVAIACDRLDDYLLTHPDKRSQLQICE